MRRPLRGIRLSKLSIGLLLFGAALLLVAGLGRWVTIGGNQISGGAPWWVPIVLSAVGLLAIGGALAAAREPARELRTVQGFLGAPPKMPTPDRLVERPDLSAAVVAALRAGDGPVALTGIGGAGKSTLAAGACGNRLLQRRFRDGVTWLEAGAGQDPVGLLSVLARRLGLPESESGFTTVVQGRDKIAAALRGKRLLVGLDNLWERGPLDALVGLAPGCAVVFTTRLPELASAFGATQVVVDELTQGQALELLGRWTGQAPAKLPAAARTLCTRVGNLALGVAMAGAMVARGRSFTDVLALIEQDLARVHADLVPAYPYRNLLAAIEAGISDLPEADQRRYAQLAVFAGRGPFPRDAAGALWQPELAEAEVSDLLAELVGRSLLTAAGDGWYAAHDLQYDVLKRRLGPAGLAAAHARLLYGYSARCPQGWPSGPDDGYFYQHLAGHLAAADRRDELAGLLTDVEWMRSRLGSGGVTGLLTDYTTAPDEPGLALVQATIRLSGHVLAVDPDQLPAQLAGRTIGRCEPALARLHAAARAWPHGAWLCPIRPTLAQPGEALRQILTRHDGWVQGVAVSADGRTAVSAGHDGTARVWDLAGDAAPRVLTGHDGPVGRRGGQRGRADRGHRRRPRRHGAGVGPGRGRRAAGAHRPRRRCHRGGGQRGRADRGQRRRLAMARCGCGTWPGPPRRGALTATTARSARWRSARTGGTGRSPAATTARCGCGTWTGTAAPRVAHGHAGPVFGGGGQRGRADRRSAAAATDGAGVGPGRDRRAAGRSPATPARCTRWRSARTGGPRSSGGGDGTVRVWDLDRDRRAAGAHRPRRRCDRGGGRRRTGGPAVIGGGDDGTVRVWDLAAGRRAAGRSPATTARCTAVAVGADGRTAVIPAATTARCGCGTWPRTAAPRAAHRPRRRGMGGGGQRGRADRGQRRPTTARCGCGTWPGPPRRRALTGHDARCHAVAVSADGRTAVTAAATTARCGCGTWTGTAAPRAAHRPRRRGAGGGGQRGRADRGQRRRRRTVRVWDLAGTAAPRVLTGHGWVAGVAVSADGRTRGQRRRPRRRRCGCGTWPGPPRRGCSPPSAGWRGWRSARTGGPR